MIKSKFTASNTLLNSAEYSIIRKRAFSLPNLLARKQQQWRTEKLPLQKNISVRSSYEGQARTFSSSLCLPSLWLRGAVYWRDSTYVNLWMGYSVFHPTRTLCGQLEYTFLICTSPNFNVLNRLVLYVSTSVVILLLPMKNNWNVAVTILSNLSIDHNYTIF